MTFRSRWSRLRHYPAFRYGLLGLGGLLLLITPLLGALPGPGGIFTFAIGLGLVLQNSFWARRRFARFKRSSPKWGALADKGLRRASARRRAQRKAEQQTD